MNNIYKFCIIIILVIIIFLFIKKINLYGVLENFEDKFQDHETYNEIYDTQFVDLYEIVYRDFTDINNDIKIVERKIVEPVKNKDELNFLVCGSGVGKLCKAIKNKHDNIIGVDISENMLRKSQSLYPNIKFVRGNLAKENIFNKKTFSHIYLDERTLYYNKFNDMNKIILNINGWLKEGGFLIAHIYDKDDLGVACRYYSSNYIDNKGNLHGFTYLNNFSHDCYYIKNDNRVNDTVNDTLNNSVNNSNDDNNSTNYTSYINDSNNTYNYYDKLVFDTGDKLIKKTILYIPPKEIIYDIIVKNGFEIYYIEKNTDRNESLGIYDLAIFRKKKTTLTIEELEKNK
jgi:ubiquinone/menaquinone biosynthesis C-methylase UbiE